jgi:hypothetical protein
LDSDQQKVKRKEEREGRKEEEEKRREGKGRGREDENDGHLKREFRNMLILKNNVFKFPLESLFHF